jgi:hypothetical protein
MIELTFFTLLCAVPVFAAWTLVDLYRTDREGFRTRILGLHETSRPALGKTSERRGPRLGIRPSTGQHGP